MCICIPGMKTLRPDQRSGWPSNILSRLELVFADNVDKVTPEKNWNIKYEIGQMIGWWSTGLLSNHCRRQNNRGAPVGEGEKQAIIMKYHGHKMNDNSPSWAVFV